MSIDPKQEPLLSLAKAAELPWLPRRRNNKPPTAGTLIRWATEGFEGVRLESVKLPGTICTSEAALLRFLSRLSEEPSLPPEPPEQVEKKASKRALETAASYLSSKGI